MDDQIKNLEIKVQRLEAIIMTLLKDKSSKDLSKIFNMSEKEVRDTKSILNNI